MTCIIEINIFFSARLHRRATTTTQFSRRALDLARLGGLARLGAKVDNKMEEHAGGGPELSAACGADSGAHGGDGDGVELPGTELMLTPNLARLGVTPNLARQQILRRAVRAESASGGGSGART